VNACSHLSKNGEREKEEGFRVIMEEMMIIY